MPKEQMKTDIDEQNFGKEKKGETDMPVIHEASHTPRAIDQFIQPDNKENLNEEEKKEQAEEKIEEKEMPSRPKTRNIDVEIPKARAQRNRRGISRGLSRKKSVNNKHLLYLQKLKEKNDMKKNIEEERIRAIKEKKQKLRDRVLRKCKELSVVRKQDSESVMSKDTNQSKKSRKGNFIIRTSKTSHRERGSVNKRKFKKSSTIKLDTNSSKSTNKPPRKLPRPPRRLVPLSKTSNDVQKTKEVEGQRRRNVNRNNLKEAPISFAPQNPGQLEGEKKSKSIAPLKAQKKKSKLRSFSFITDVKQWLKKNRLPPKSKVFVVGNGYTCIKKALKDRGWISNPDYFSTCFHLKFTLRGSHIEYDSLKPYQIVNHFEKVSCLTTKIGICRTLNNLHLYTNVNVDSFFPRCFDCNEEMEFESFVVYYKLTRAESILKKFLDLALEDKREDEEYKKMIDSKMVDVALKVTNRRLMDLGELVRTKKNWVEVTDKEWAILSKGDVTEDEIKKLLYSQNVKRYLKLEKKLKKKKKKKKKKKIKVKKKTEDPSLQKIQEENEEEKDESEDDEEETDQTKLTAQEKEIQSAIKRLEKKFPQTKMNGKNNIWIIKPAGLSRGRGIRLFSSYHEIVHHIKTRNFSWIIQKYMENPLVYQKKKIDIRQWVLVTDWNPLTIWFYQECYVRISTGEYSLNNLNDRYVHLTNNSVNKKAANFVQEDGFMAQEETIRWLDGEFGEGAFKKIQKQMKKQIKWSLMAAQEQVENRKGSSEILGYDFCIDEDLKVWLIEINASPDFTFSSTVTEALVRKASEDYVKVMVDYGMSKKRNKKNIDTGLFKRIYKSRTHKKCKEALGLKFEVVGKKMKTDKCRKLFRKEDKEFKKNKGMFDEELKNYVPESEESEDESEDKEDQEVEDSQDEPERDDGDEGKEAKLDDEEF